MIGKRKFLVGALVASSTLSAAVTWWNVAPESRQTYAAESKSPAINSNKVAVAKDLSEAFQTVAAAIKPSVVSISSSKRAQPLPQPRAGRRQQAPQLPPGIPEEFRQFFDDDVLNQFGRQFEQTPDRFGQMPERQPDQMGLGSGVIVSEDGYILTNNHVVNGFDEFKVTLFDDREYRAKLVGADAKTDLAVLKIEAKNLTAAALGNSDQLKVGQWVLAIGSPFGLDQTVTAGIISAKGRVTGIIGRDGYEDFLQTDAAINPGNSGGPLVNLHGEVIGVNTAIASQGARGNMGVGFAISSNMAGHVMESLISTGKVVRGYLGARIQSLNEGLADSFGFTGHGVLIGDVVPNSPADKAGLHKGDIVTKLNGSGVETHSQLRNSVAALSPKTKVQLEVFRDGKTQVIPVTVGELASDATVTPSEDAAESAGGLGLTVESLTRDLADRIGHRGSLSGVVVTNVASGSAADRAMIEPGDVIVAVGRTSVKSASDYRDAIAKVELKKGVRLEVLREGESRFVFVREE